ncbi:MAG: NADH-quinone oxidoreductase subunit NuoK [Candidatus Lernaella stagnicola]|nr:NADH-quinone oxidoreductase subunit NuoK [Candidatus Lernaella stagnicola]
MIPVSFPLITGAFLFALGAFGVIVRRNAIVVFMCIELMLNGVNLTLIGLAGHQQVVDGPVFVLFIMAVAAAEAAVGLAIIISLYRRKGTVDVSSFDSLKG